MAYSDTYGQVYNVQTVIDHAARRCGKLAEELTSEQVLSARESLGFVLTNLINIYQARSIKGKPCKVATVEIRSRTSGDNNSSTYNLKAA